MYALVLLCFTAIWDDLVIDITGLVTTEEHGKEESLLT